jgi:hypothetical protein
MAQRDNFLPKFNMTTAEIISQLENIASAEDFEWQSSQLVNSWSAQGVGIEIVEPILRFMEKNSGIEYGIPGHLVSFLEQFYKKGYEQLLLESIKRKPTAQTLLMLNRLIMGTKDTDARRCLTILMDQSRFNPQADDAAIEWANEFLEEL